MGMSNEEIMLRSKLFGLESRLGGELNPIEANIKSIEREIAELNEKAAIEGLSHYDEQTMILLKAKLATLREFKGSIICRYRPEFTDIKEQLAEINNPKSL